MQRTTLAFLMLFVPTVTMAQEASKSACVFDYIRHCSAHRIGSDGLAKCLEKNGLSLSPGCLKALVDDGLTTREYINARAKEKGLVTRLTGEGIEFDRDMSVMAEAQKTEESKPDIVTPEAEPIEEFDVSNISPNLDAPPPKASVIEGIKERAKSATGSLKTKTKAFGERVRKALSGIKFGTGSAKEDDSPNPRHIGGGQGPKNPRNDYYRKEAEKDPIGSRKFPMGNAW